MSGPIVRTGTTPEFWKNWDRVFGKGKAKAEAGESGSADGKPAKKASKKSAGSAAAKKSGGKKASRKAAPGKTS